MVYFCLKHITGGEESGNQKEKKMDGDKEREERPPFTTEVVLLGIVFPLPTVVAFFFSFSSSLLPFSMTLSRSSRSRIGPDLGFLEP